MMMIEDNKERTQGTWNENECENDRLVLSHTLGSTCFFKGSCIIIMGVCVYDSKWWHEKDHNSLMMMKGYRGRVEGRGPSQGKRWMRDR